MATHTVLSTCNRLLSYAIHKAVSISKIKACFSWYSGVALALSNGQVSGNDPNPLSFLRSSPAEQPSTAVGESRVPSGVRFRLQKRAATLQPRFTVRSVRVGPLDSRSRETSPR